MYTLFAEKGMPSVKKEDEPENLASKLRGNWMFSIIPSAGKGKLPMGNCPIPPKNICKKVVKAGFLGT